MMYTSGKVIWEIVNFNSIPKYVGHLELHCVWLDSQLQEVYVITTSPRKIYKIINANHGPLTMMIPQIQESLVRWILQWTTINGQVHNEIFATLASAQNHQRQLIATHGEGRCHLYCVPEYMPGSVPCVDIEKIDASQDKRPIGSWVTVHANAKLNAVGLGKLVTEWIVDVPETRGEVLQAVVVEFDNGDIYKIANSVNGQLRILQ